MNLRELDLKIVTEPIVHSVPIELRRREGLVKHASSAYLTPAHIDVTSRPVTYAPPKAFRFPSRRELRVMDADRWVRQRVKKANRVAVSELPPVQFSVDNRDTLRATRRFDRSAFELIYNALANASRRFHVHGKIAR